MTRSNTLITAVSGMLLMLTACSSIPELAPSPITVVVPAPNDFKMNVGITGLEPNSNVELDIQFEYVNDGKACSNQMEKVPVTYTPQNNGNWGMADIAVAGACGPCVKDHCSGFVRLRLWDPVNNVFLSKPNQSGQITWDPSGDLKKQVVGPIGSP